MILHFACPKCGADMAYSIKLGKLYCQHCEYSEDIGSDPEEWRRMSENAEEARAASAHEAAGQDTAGEAGQEPAAPEAGAAAADEAGHETPEDYVQPQVCPNCGSPVSAGAKTCSTKCEYCDTSLILAERLQGDMRPASVLPFKLDRDNVTSAFLKWCHRGRFSPKGFASAKNIKKITPMYVPYWLYDMNLDVSVQAVATNVNIYQLGDIEYTETSFYDVGRDMNLEYHLVPFDASEKLDDTLMAKIQPYNYDELKDFQIPYLAGFMTDQRDYSDSDLLPQAKQKVNEYAAGYARSTINGYGSVNIRHENVNYNTVDSRYVYLPLWFISYPFKDKEYIFAMNGQTGKVIGTPPLSAGKVVLWFLGISAVIFAVLILTGGLF